MAVPDRSAARLVLAAGNPPEWLVVHSEGVARVAAEAARMLAYNGVSVDPLLVEAAARLHDIDKMETRANGPHGLAGAERLTGLGYGELADPVASHPFYCLLDPERFPRSWAAICVSVADRRVGQHFSGIGERLDDLATRYPDDAEPIHAAREPAEALEARLADAAGLTRRALEVRLRDAWADGDR
ncbi:MAG: HDIG domain-containing metalloprotein [Candidatus Limnocylindria bacterium]